MVRIVPQDVAQQGLGFVVPSLAIQQDGEAETLLRELVRDYPEDADAAYMLGLLVVETGKPDEGIRWLTRAAEARPRDARVRYNLGLLLQQQGRLDEAGRALRRAVELEPRGLDYLHAYADHLARRGRREQALALVERMIELYPDQPIGHQMKAAINSRQQ